MRSNGSRRAAVPPPRPLVVVAAILLLASAASARQFGIAKGGTSCGGCHGNTPSESVSVSLVRPGRDATSLLPGEMGFYTISIEPEFGVGAGLDVAIEGGGSLMVFDPNTQLFGDSGEITHTDSGQGGAAGNIGDWSYRFLVLAPDEEGATLTLKGVALGFDGDEGPDGDLWNIASLTISVPEPGAELQFYSALASLALVYRWRARRASARPR